MPWKACESTFAAQPVESVLDAAVFGPCRAPVRDVMAGGRWVVRNGHHREEESVFGKYRMSLERLTSS